MAKLYNRVAVATGTTGTGTVTLGSALSAAFCTFSEAGVQNADSVTYLITEGTNFELGRGTYTAVGTTLARDTVLLSKIGGTAGTTKMTLAGAAEVRIAAAAEDMLDIRSGIWTPVFEFTTNGDLSVSYATQSGRYKKHGNLVWISCDLVFTPTWTTMTGQFFISGLPFVASASQISRAGLAISAVALTWGASWRAIQFAVPAGTSTIRGGAAADGSAVANLANTAFPTGTQSTIRVNGWYETDL